jgi:hypothetical protein
LFQESGGVGRDVGTVDYDAVVKVFREVQEGFEGNFAETIDFGSSVGGWG